VVFTIFCSVARTLTLQILLPLKSLLGLETWAIINTAGYEE
jgi:hypothetical protein